MIVMMNMTDVEETNSEVRGTNTEELVNLVEGKKGEMPEEKNGLKGKEFSSSFEFYIYLFVLMTIDP